MLLLRRVVGALEEADDSLDEEIEYEGDGYDHRPQDPGHQRSGDGPSGNGEIREYVTVQQGEDEAAHQDYGYKPSDDLGPGLGLDRLLRLGE